jgi:YbbR domain-containing protein
MRWLASNIRTFLLALVLGVAVWISAVTSDDPDEIRTVTVPLEIVGQAPLLVNTNELPETVDITLRAPRSGWELLNAQENSVQAVLDLSGLGSGEYAVDIVPQVSLRPVQIVLHNPTTVTVHLEPIISRTLDLELSLSGQTATGYQTGPELLDPTQVTISGPESIVRQAARARVLFNLGGTRESIDQFLNIQIVDERNIPVRELTISPETVHISIPVSQQGGYRDVAVKVVLQGQQAAGYRIENISVFPSVITLFSSDPEVVNGIPGVVETLPLDLQNAQDDINARLTLNLPADISIIGSQTVQVTVDVSPIQTSLTLLNQPIHVIGLPEGLAAQVSPQEIDVIISGPVPVLEALTLQDVIITVDVTGLGIGTHQLEPDVEILAGGDNVLIESILPGTIEVIISIPGTPTITPFPTP